MNKNALDKRTDQVFQLLGLSATFFGLLVLAALIIDVLIDGFGRLSWDFLTSFPSRKPAQAGIFSA
jgi:phosphate transport system permease protein